ncbi:MAG TPA: SGNH/GDSL hydrolase family protein [Terracidiphilus sp.]|nr:SGNH/GDSL hydrolase family protein [Terracidiphilus sp.]
MKCLNSVKLNTSLARLFTVLAAILLVNGIAATMRAQEQVSRPEEIEWTWEVRPAHPDPKLPNVLLIGDSITRNYYPEVKRQLADVANVYLFASSACVGDPRLLSQLSEFATMESVPFRVVHFNNGMHGWTYSEAEYKAGFPDYLARIRAIAPGAALVWSTTTPVKTESVPGPTNARIRERNSIAQAFIRAATIPIDDQYALMLKHPDRYQDNVHFDYQGSIIQGQQAAQDIWNLLPKPQD